jgi:pantothenate kinase-related protein Tda10
MRRVSKSTRLADTLIFLYARSYDEKEETKRPAHFSSRGERTSGSTTMSMLVALSLSLCLLERSTVSWMGCR